MPQAKFSLTERQLAFLDRYQEYGFKDRSDLVRSAVDRLRVEAERAGLEQSADLYAQLYESDPTLRAMTDEARSGWPE